MSFFRFWRKKKKSINKRDIFRFNGLTDTAINLEHVTSMALIEKKITFSFYTNQIFVELENNEAAKTCYEQLLNIWSSYGVE